MSAEPAARKSGRRKPGSQVPEQERTRCEVADPEAGTAGQAPVAPARSAATTQAERAVMHPESHDTEWRYYHGACRG